MSTLQPGQQIRPSVSTKGAVLLVEKLYGVKVQSVKELNSYDDKNFLVTIESVEDRSNLERNETQQYTLKILNSLDSQKRHVGEIWCFQNCIYFSPDTNI